ncbi:MAG TPA: redox-sensing transcriptional repressor Rex [Rectinemataceae bacterium]|nr:redox-sensing transcriptional repressor Rex [Rectinemataceae bacterium]
MTNKQKVSYAPSVRRLPSYLNIIRHAQSNGDQFISGTVIANELNLEPIQVRKDLAITGIIGKPKKGYPVNDLVLAIESYLGWNVEHKAIVVGAGNLGSALSGYQEFKNHGLNIVAAFDTDPSKVGTTVHGVPIYPLEKLEDIIPEIQAEIAILTVPSPFANSTCDSIVKAGIKSIWNFTNIKLKVPKNIIVWREDLSSGYAMLAVMMKIALKGETVEL